MIIVDNIDESLPAQEPDRDELIHRLYTRPEDDNLVPTLAYAAMQARIDADLLRDYHVGVEYWLLGLLKLVKEDERGRIDEIFASEPKMFNSWHYLVREDIARMRRYLGIRDLDATMLRSALYHELQNSGGSLRSRVTSCLEAATERAEERGMVDAWGEDVLSLLIRFPTPPTQRALDECDRWQGA